ncbi:MAG: 4'-phosphopantetheinyl transferase superfamily protein [Deltaproteobacteria bacterium]|nr:4'-phosphopantetheinyl transferase superfamily protein [Deltaproteobacteria bacterium]
MIRGIGIDLCEIPAMEARLADPASHFLATHFTAQERATLAERGSGWPAQHAAARYAAKEAVIKALSQAAGGAVLLPTIGGAHVPCGSASGYSLVHPLRGCPDSVVATAPSSGKAAGASPSTPRCGWVVGPRTPVRGVSCAGEAFSQGATGVSPWGPTVDYREIEIVAVGTGVPQVRLHGAVRTVATQLGVAQIALSLSHEAAMAVAMVVIV